MERERSEKFFVDLPEIQTERLLLRKVTPGDAEDMLAYISDPEVARHTTWEPYDSIEQVRDHLRSVISNYERGEPANWGVTLRESGRLIGMCGFMAGSWEPEYARASLGYAIAREYWDRGLTTEAVRAAIAFGFNHLSLNRIEARCIAENTASERVMQKAGLSYEGTLRDYVFRKGAYRDYKVYSILRREHSSK
ncbi:MAG: GNAT family N-acetyltransferase [Actinomycetota bacterium]|nr:GNAT family N-acetyltransferase [Actinomycetota bacterium]MDQ3567476.1 GNAT family N-acetyltransferase [Actinomycetota bacterium]